MHTKIKLKIERCKGCSICANFCVKNVLSLDKLGKVYVVNEEDCIGCGRCEDLCPDFAIFVFKEV